MNIYIYKISVPKINHQYEIINYKIDKWINPKIDKLYINCD